MWDWLKFIEGIGTIFLVGFGFGHVSGFWRGYRLHEKRSKRIRV